MALISVIMPTYNGAAYLAQALESLCQEDDGELEVIAVDDGSTDETLRILDIFSSRLKLRVLALPHYGSWVGNVNRGVRESAGEFVTVLHQDDFWLPGRLSLLRELLAAFPEAALWLHSAVFADSKGRRVGLWKPPFGAKRRLVSPSEIIPKLLVQNFVAMPVPLVKRSLLEEIGGFDEKLWYTADWKLWLETVLRGPWGYDPKPCAAFRLHAGSQTVQGAAKRGALEAQLAAVQEEFFARLPGIQTGKTRTLATASNEINACLAETFGTGRVPWVRTLRAVIPLFPFAWIRLFYYSRLHERVGARLRVNLSRA